MISSFICYVIYYRYGSPYKSSKPKVYSLFIKHLDPGSATGISKLAVNLIYQFVCINMEVTVDESDRKSSLASLNHPLQYQGYKMPISRESGPFISGHGFVMCENMTLRFHTSVIAQVSQAYHLIWLRQRTGRC